MIGSKNESMHYVDATSSGTCGVVGVAWKRGHPAGWGTQSPIIVLLSNLFRKVT